MKSGRSLQELAAELSRQNEVKRDYLIDTRRLEMDAQPAAAATLTLKAQGVQHVFDVNEIAHRQIGAYLEIPRRYYEKMRGEYPELLAQNVNGWFGQNQDTRMVRTLDGTARAFLSDRYRRIDNMEIAEAVLPIIGEMPDARVESCEVTDERLYLKVVNPRLETEVVPGDVVQAGIMITNSEVGMGSVRVTPLVYRLVCKNGMVVNDAATRRNHVGRTGSADENFELYSDETLRADDRAFMLKIQDTVRAAVDTARFGKVIDIMRSARDAKIVTTRVPEMVELTALEHGLSKREGQGVLDYLIKGGDLTLYGMANAVTRFSQDTESYDRATELETLGYKVLTMSRGEWHRLNERADSKQPAA